ncbi:CAP domain-containing protein [Streptomyces sp. NBC_00566]|uniref:CAP domain-containing protein n=1 Tax=Streptomyces sp. NBC_00566 TaxID=2975778 RepID=UPI002E817150|nr:CAP domain-containing protein [Streptomyces sp. NBC_00566]WUB85325.1 CAP domain-containing protein [Streptomyces sp. NBC_00566]
MGKHRKSQQYRRALIAAVAVGAVGVPTAAVACVDWKDDPRQPTEATAWQAEQAPHHESHHVPKQDGDRDPGPAAATTPSASPSVRTRTEHRPAHHRTTQATAPKAKRTAEPATAKPAAPKSASAKPVPAPTVRQVSTRPRPVQTATTTAPSTPQPAATASGAVARVVELVNAERAKVGCSPVQLNSTLSKAAQDHSADMAAHNTMSHTGSDGSDPGSRITAAGYQWSAYGENVAYGYSTPEQVMAGWMDSPGHRENILNCSFKEIGVGLAQPGSYWTQDFGTAR